MRLVNYFLIVSQINVYIYSLFKKSNVCQHNRRMLPLQSLVEKFKINQTLLLFF